MSTTKTGQKPTHEVFAVKKGAEGEKAFWTKIGAAWPHKDGNGFALTLACYPAEGQTIQLRVIKPKAEKGGAQ